MKVYKEKQYLIFDFENGKNVKYDFANKECIGIKGSPVNNLCSQLKGFSIDDIVENCIDVQYGKFLKYVRDIYSRQERKCYNVGTILEKVPRYKRYEQIFSAGIEDICTNENFSRTINDIPKGLLKICKEYKIEISNDLCDFYKENPNILNVLFETNFMSLEKEDIIEIVLKTRKKKKYYGDLTWQYKYVNVSVYQELIQDYKYNAKSLALYVDYLKTYEAIEDVGFLIKEIYDYACMMKKISNKFDKYPRHFLTTHKIACRNYNRLIEKFDEECFEKIRREDMEKTFGDYVFIYPKTTQDIKDEAVQQNNCVASYIKRVINGSCHILFLRKKDSIDKSLVTIEVSNGKIVQAKRKFNDPVSKEEQQVIDKWNKWFNEKQNEREDV